jgi:hypothetical protein
MSILNCLRPIEVNKVPENHLLVVHPLDDAPEKKADTESLRPMPMTTSVKLSLMALRGYLFLMILLALYHVMDLAGAFGRHAN